MSNTKKDATVSVRLLCAHVGDGDGHFPGDVIEVDAAEAERLIDLGAAEPA